MLVELMEYAKNKLKEAEKQGEDIPTLRYWAGYVDGVKAALQKAGKK